jgi:hypothetical protein
VDDRRNYQRHHHLAKDIGRQNSGIGAHRRRTVCGWWVVGVRRQGVGSEAALDVADRAPRRAASNVK